MPGPNLTFRGLLQQLAEIAEHSPNCIVRINGEYVTAISIVVQIPKATIGDAHGRTEKVDDPYRPDVIDVSTNGRRPTPLLDASYPYGLEKRLGDGKLPSGALCTSTN